MIEGTPQTIGQKIDHLAEQHDQTVLYVITRSWIQILAQPTTSAFLIDLAHLLLERGFQISHIRQDAPHTSIIAQPTRLTQMA